MKAKQTSSPMPRGTSEGKSPSPVSDAEKLIAIRKWLATFADAPEKKWPPGARAAWFLLGLLRQRDDQMTRMATLMTSISGLIGDAMGMAFQATAIPQEPMQSYRIPLDTPQQDDTIPNTKG